MPDPTHFDLAVIGGGSGGLACAKRAADHGARVVLIEQDELGGTCVNRGCVPKKLMWEAAGTLLRASDMAEQGLTAAAPPLDFAALTERRDARVAAIRDSYRDALDARGIALIRAPAHLAAPGRIDAGGQGIRADHVVLATGAAPVVPDLPGAGLAAASDDVFGWRDLPASLLIVGGGYIGCEFASILAAFGTRVTLVTASDRLLERFDAEAVACATDNLAQQGVDLRFGASLTGLSRHGTATEATFDGTSPVRAHRVLLATGRRARAEAVATLAPPPRRANSGAFAVDAWFQTTVPGLYAVGDAADRLPLTPVATRDGEALADMLFGAGAARIPLDLVASAAFLHPPIAQVGARIGGADTHDLVCSRSTPLRADVLAPGRKAASQFSKIAHDPDTGHLRGACLVGDDAPDTIATSAALIASGAKARCLGRATAVHPTSAEEYVGR